ncbi:hypothetical protein HYV50_00620 [Candidatus Pacearchaeota archaeon]|nr:hypothetical protein [Candidatus Pacearchaeota archaeon]
MKIEKLNKKGLAEIVITLSLVLIIIAAAFLLYNTLIKPIGTKTLSPEFNCIDLQIKNPITINNVCFSQETNETEATLTRSSENININSLTFIISYENSESSWICENTNSCPGCEILAPGTTKTYFFSEESSKNPKTLSLYYYTCKLGEKNIVKC